MAQTVTDSVSSVAETKIRLGISDSNARSTDRPDAGQDCGHWRLHRHGQITKAVNDYRVPVVMVTRDESLDGPGAGIALTQWL